MEIDQIMMFIEPSNIGTNKPDIEGESLYCQQINIKIIIKEFGYD